MEGTGIYVSSGTLTVGSTSSTNNTYPLITSSSGYAINGNFTMYSGRLRSNKNTKVYNGTNSYTTKTGYYWHYESSNGNYDYYWGTDTTGPTVTFETNGSTTYKKSQSTKVTVTDPGGSGVKTSSLKYQWKHVSSSSQPTESSFSTTFTNGGTITKSTETGVYYLYVLAKDNMGNTTIAKSNTFFFDNGAPTGVGITANTSATANSVTLTGKARDSYSGIKWYAWTDSASTPSSWTQLSTATTSQVSYTYSLAANATKYFHVKDEAGNTNSSSYTVTNIVPKVTDVTLTGPTVLINNTLTITKTISGSISYKSISFSSSNTGVVSITDTTAGTIKGIAAGTATITCTVTNWDGTTVSGTCMATVKSGVAKLNNTGVHYNSVQAAINATTNDTVTMLTSVTESPSVSAGRTIILDLSTCTITGSVTNYGTLTVKGSGTITSSNRAINNSGGTLTVSEGTIKSTSTTLATIADSSTAKTYISGGTITHDGDMRTVYITGTAEVSGGTIESSASGFAAIAVEGSQADLIVSGGTIQSSNKEGFALNVLSGSATLKGGTIKNTSKKGGVALRVHGTATQKGCTISGGNANPSTKNDKPTIYIHTGGHFTYSSGTLSGTSDNTYLIYVEKNGNAFKAGAVTKKTYPNDL